MPDPDKLWAKQSQCISFRTVGKGSAGSCGQHCAAATQHMAGWREHCKESAGQRFQGVFFNLIESDPLCLDSILCV